MATPMLDNPAANLLQFAYIQEKQLHQITRSLHHSLDETVILTEMLESIAASVSVAYCNTASYRADLMRGAVIHHIAHQPAADTANWLIPGHEFNQIYGQLLEQKSLQICAPWLQEAEPWGSFCIVLIQGSDQVPLGDILLVRPRDHVFDPLEIDFIKAIAQEAAIAISNARQYARSMADSQELRHLVTLREQCLSALSDQLRAPLATMRMAVQMLHQTATADRRHQYLQLLESECIRGIELLNGLTQYQGQDDVSTAGIWIQEWLPPIVESYQEHAKSLGLSIRLDLGRKPLPMIYSDRFSLGLVIQDLLEGAMRYAKPPGEIAIYVQEERINDQVGICIAIGNPSTIPDAELPHLFEAFYRVPGRDRGDRLGLNFIKKVVGELNGTVRATSNDGWTCFYVWIPQYLTLQSLSRLTGVGADTSSQSHS